MDDIRKQHDELIAKASEDLSEKDLADFNRDHEKSCLICNESNHIDPNERGDMEKTYTLAELNSAVADAVAPLQAKLDEIEASVADSEVAAQIESIKTETAEELAAKEATLDAKDLELQAAKTELTELKSYLEAEAQRVEAETAAAARKDARLAEVKEVASFSDERIAERIDAWTAMSDEDWSSLVEDWKSLPTVEKNESAEEAGEITEIETAVEGTRKSTKGSAVSGLGDLVRGGALNRV